MKADLKERMDRLSQDWGAEFEFIPPSRQVVYDCVPLNNGWGLHEDGSVRADHRGGVSWIEVTTPPFTFGNIDSILSVLRKLRNAGCYTNQTCGGHIHISAAPFTGTTLANLCRGFHKYTPFVYKAAEVSTYREYWAKRYCPEFVAELDRRRPQELNQMRSIWQAFYGDDRYLGLNLRPAFYRGTIEFRFPNGTLEEAQFKAHLALVMGLAVKALEANQTSSKQRPLRGDASDLRDWRVWLNSAGLVGSGFKAEREVLTRAFK